MSEYDNYISIIVPYFNRIHYLKDLIDSVHDKADMPFELIVHDDASSDGSTSEVFSLVDDMSTLIINRGHNLGLSSSTNRLVSCASSEYIVFLNSDCILETPCLRNIYEILQRPYIGVVCLVNYSHIDKNIDETKFILGGGGAGCAMAFRKSVWENVGKWLDVPTSASDIGFIFQTLRKGYFTAYPYGKKYVTNVSAEKMHNADSSMGITGYDNSLSKIFGMFDEQYNRTCKAREHILSVNANNLIDVPASIANMGYWVNYTNGLFYTDEYSKYKTTEDKINWEIGKIHNHDKWKNEILNDNAIVWP